MRWTVAVPDKTSNKIQLATPTLGWPAASSEY